MKKLKYIKPEAEVVHFHLMERGICTRCPAVKTETKPAAAATL